MKKKGIQRNVRDTTSKEKGERKKNGWGKTEKA